MLCGLKLTLSPKHNPEADVRDGSSLGQGKCPLIRRMSVGRSLARRSSRIYIYGTAQPLDGRTDRAADSSVRIKAYFSHSERLERLAGLLDTTAHTHTHV